ncbi:MAG: glycosyltransferase [Elusimicrobiota bacterium]
MANPSLIIVVPTMGGRAQYLSQALKNLLAQTYPNFELILVDNGSKDDTRALASSITDKRFSYVRHEDCLGMGDDWNRALKIALEKTPAYVGLFHDDDLYAPTLLEKEIALMEQYPEAGFVYAAQYYYSVQENRGVLYRPYPQDRMVNARDLWKEIAQNGFYHISTPCVLMRHEALEKVGLFDPQFKIAPDLDLFWRILERYSMAFVSEPLFIHRVHSNQASLSQEGRSKGVLELLQILEKALNSHCRIFPDIIRPEVLRGISTMVAKIYLSSMGDMMKAGRFEEIQSLYRQSRRFKQKPSAAVRLKLLIFKLLANSPVRFMLQGIAWIRHRARRDLRGLPAWAK